MCCVGWQHTIYLDGADPESGDGMGSLMSATLMDMDGIDNAAAYGAGGEVEDLERDSEGQPMRHDHDEHSGDSEGDDSADGARKKRQKSRGGIGVGPVDAKVKIALSLYKVQQNIYLLDFQRVEVGVEIEAPL